MGGKGGPMMSSLHNMSLTPTPTLMSLNSPLITSRAAEEGMEEGSEGEEGPEEACVWEGGGRETGSVFAAHMYSERL